MFDAIGPPLLGIFPFVMMFIVTSITTLRERSSGMLERLLTMPMGKLDLILGYAISFGLLAVMQATLASLVAVPDDQPGKIGRHQAGLASPSASRAMSSSSSGSNGLVT